MQAALDQILLNYTSTQQVLGVAFIVKERGDKTLYSGASGQLAFDHDVAFTTDSVCWIASMTKLVTAVAAMQLVEQQRLGLDDDVGKIVPEIAELDVLDGFTENDVPKLVKTETCLTLRHLLTHTSGFCYDLYDEEMMRWRRATHSRLNAECCSFEAFTVPLKFQPGQGWVYGVGPDWVGRLIEVVTGLSLQDYMEQNIFNPLDMKSTTFRIRRDAHLSPRRATMTTYGQALGRVMPTTSEHPEPAPIDSGGQGLFSTASDYATFLGCLLDGGRGILKESTLKQLLEPQFGDPKFLLEVMHGELHDFFVPQHPKLTPFNHGLGGLINTEDIPKKRKKGSISWSGVINSHWWIDPTAGIAGTLFVQVMPSEGNPVPLLYTELEEAVYKSIYSKVAERQ